MAVYGNRAYEDTLLELKNTAAQAGFLPCAAQCPAGAIPDGAYSQVLKDRCISCMRCLALCPARAKKISPDRLAPLTQKLEKACASRKGNELFL